MTHYYTDAATGARSERSLTLALAHVRWTDYVAAGNGIALTVSTTDTSYTHSSVNVTRSYLHRDHLGSTTMVTDAAGAVVQRMAYDAWGKRRNPNGSADPTGSLESSGLPNRGYTDHEHLEELGLIHMNGRLYDPLIARMVSADPLVSDPFSTQVLNRYAYVDNNPLTYTDPTGYLKWGRILRTVVAIAAAVVIMQPQWGLAAVMGLSTTQGAILAGAVAGAISSGSLQGAVMGGLSAGLFSGLESVVSSTVLRIGLSGAIGGTMSVMQGGKFGSGFLAAGFTATFSPILRGIENLAARTAVAAVIGGVGSRIGGGKFENGAITGAFTALFTGLAEEAGAMQTAPSNQNPGPSTLPVGQSRLLTTDETNLAKDIFGNEVDYSKVRIFNRKYSIFAPNDSAMAPDGNIYFPNHLYRDNFAAGDVGIQGWFLHEMTHVWQVQTTGSALGFGYGYSLVNGKSFSSYSKEQQASIVADYHRIRSGVDPIHADKRYTGYEYRSAIYQ